jgi:hypothetical protein
MPQVVETPVQRVGKGSSLASFSVYMLSRENVLRTPVLHATVVVTGIAALYPWVISRIISCRRE